MYEQLIKRLSLLATAEDATGMTDSALAMREAAAALGQATPPASRIAELEREVERLREALGVMLKGNEMGEVECQRTGFPRMITRHEMARKALAQEKK